MSLVLIRSCRHVTKSWGAELGGAESGKLTPHHEDSIPLHSPTEDLQHLPTTQVLGQHASYHDRQSLQRVRLAGIIGGTLPSPLQPRREQLIEERLLQR